LLSFGFAHGFGRAREPRYARRACARKVWQS